MGGMAVCLPMGEVVVGSHGADSGATNVGCECCRMYIKVVLRNGSCPVFFFGIFFVIVRMQPLEIMAKYALSVSCQQSARRRLLQAPLCPPRPVPRAIERTKEVTKEIMKESQRKDKGKHGSCPYTYEYVHERENAGDAVCGLLSASGAARLLQIRPKHLERYNTLLPPSSTVTSTTTACHFHLHPQSTSPWYYLPVGDQTCSYRLVPETAWQPRR
jgi:hypothetical protein